MVVSAWYACFYVHMDVGRMEVDWGMDTEKNFSVWLYSHKKVAGNKTARLWELACMMWGKSICELD